MNWRHTANFHAVVYSFQFLLWLTTEKLWTRTLSPHPLKQLKTPSLWTFPKELHVHISTSFLSAQGPRAYYSRPSFVVLLGSYSATELVWRVMAIISLFFRAFMRNPLLSCWLGLSKTPKTLQVIATALGCPQRYYLKPYCWRYYTLQKRGPDAPEPELSCKFSLWELSFMVPEGTMQASKGGKQPTDNLNPAVRSMNHSNDQYGMITLRVLQ